jgi:ABC-type branched-subunit amino acid transport system permease subunit
MSVFIQPGFWIFVLTMAGIYGIFSLGLQVQYGVGGIMNFGHVGMMALSSYTMAILVISHGWNFWVAAFCGVVVAGLGGAFLGLTTLRLSGDYFSIVSIAFSEIVRYVIFNSDGLTGGTQGSMNIPAVVQTEYPNSSYVETWNPFIDWVRQQLARVFGAAADRDMAMATIVWITLGILLLVISRLERTAWARVLRSTREDDDVPSALGKNVFQFRLQAVIIGSVIAGIAGIYWALQYTLLSPDDFLTLVTFYGWMILILAGAPKVKGIAIGAIFFGLLYGGTRFFTFYPFSLLDAAQRSNVRIMIIGIVLIILMTRRPQGIFGKRQEMVLE